MVCLESIIIVPCRNYSYRLLLCNSVINLQQRKHYNIRKQLHEISCLFNEGKGSYSNSVSTWTIITTLQELI